LLDDDYYEFMKTGVSLSYGIPVLGAAHLIPFKAKAWLDLKERKAQGSQVDSKNIRKHKNDILKLSALLHVDFKLTLPSTVLNDMRRFFAEVEEPEKYARIVAAYDTSSVSQPDK